MATYMKHVMEIYFDNLVSKHGYDRFVLQQVWDETNIVVKNAIISYQSSSSSTTEEKVERSCPYVYSKGENAGKACGIKIKDKNRQMCYRHTKELQSKKKSNHDKHVEVGELKKHLCPYVITKGNDTGKCCGVNIKNPRHTHCHKHYKKVLEKTKKIVSDSEFNESSPVVKSTPIPMSPVPVVNEDETEHTVSDTEHTVSDTEHNGSSYKELGSMYKELGLDSDSESESEDKNICEYTLKKGKLNTKCKNNVVEGQKYCTIHVQKKPKYVY